MVIPPMRTLMLLCQMDSIPRHPYTKLYPNKHVCFIRRLFPDVGDPTHVKLDALTPEQHHTPSSLHKAILIQACVLYAQALSK